MGIENVEELTGEPQVVVDPVTGEPTTETGTPEPDTRPPEEREGNDQEAGVGIDPPAVTEDDLEDAPEVAPEDDDDALEPDGPHTPVSPERERLERDDDAA